MNIQSGEYNFPATLSDTEWLHLRVEAEAILLEKGYIVTQIARELGMVRITVPWGDNTLRYQPMFASFFCSSEEREAVLAQVNSIPQAKERNKITPLCY